jgi:anti-anti-sigma regulatory factor
LISDFPRRKKGVLQQFFILVALIILSKKMKRRGCEIRFCSLNPLFIRPLDLFYNLKIQTTIE